MGRRFPRIVDHDSELLEVRREFARALTSIGVPCIHRQHGLGGKLVCWASGDRRLVRGEFIVKSTGLMEVIRLRIGELGMPIDAYPQRRDRARLGLPPLPDCYTFDFALGRPDLAARFNWRPSGFYTTDEITAPSGTWLEHARWFAALAARLTGSVGPEILRSFPAPPGTSVDPWEPPGYLWAGGSLELFNASYKEAQSRKAARHAS